MIAADRRKQASLGKYMMQCLARDAVRAEREAARIYAALWITPYLPHKRRTR